LNHQEEARPDGVRKTPPKSADRSDEPTAEKFIREHLAAIKRNAAKRYGVSLKHLDEHFGDKMLHQITSASCPSSRRSSRRGAADRRS
jgi:hypothetical protein